MGKDTVSVCLVFSASSSFLQYPFAKRRFIIFVFIIHWSDRISERYKEGQHMVSAPKESAVSCGCHITYLK